MISWLFEKLGRNSSKIQDKRISSYLNQDIINKKKINSSDPTIDTSASILKNDLKSQLEIIEKLDSAFAINHNTLAYIMAHGAMIMKRDLTKDECERICYLVLPRVHESHIQSLFMMARHSLAKASEGNDLFSNANKNVIPVVIDEMRNSYKSNFLLDEIERMKSAIDGMFNPTA
ncbi:MULTISPECIES: hypothetical protein [Vibrio]|uniref:hypothetical protein n=1 Tax=Vibrio TaxID=662 RepID=UPI001CDC442D|nr:MULTISPECIES: hypothetical protein [Vibrio]MDF4384407.1 hypothetical protein [Vibrio parahaemolyticus]MCA2452966.1 hypothetical protein [Vibrio alginolyticus]MCA2476851.1 hypothetical protein [Vibrio alginolyticus]MDW1501091.1 hypothetical protein [Vibrio sp. YT-19(2023)]MDW1568121.1 hypothetical protein [Vibrio sp. YT-15]